MRPRDAIRTTKYVDIGNLTVAEIPVCLNMCCEVKNFLTKLRDLAATTSCAIGQRLFGLRTKSQMRPRDAIRTTKYVDIGNLTVAEIPVCLNNIKKDKVYPLSQ
jgi:hypothetical protein